MRVLVSVVLLVAVAVNAQRPLSSFIKDRSSKPIASGRFAPALQSKFAKFCESRNRLYKNAADLERHMAAFEKFEKIVADHQKNEQGTAEHGETIFADLDHDEFVKLHTGGRLPTTVGSNDTVKFEGKPIRGLNSRQKRAAPTCVDYRNQGVVSPVKDQGSCGNCYVFASLGVLESVYSMKYGLTNANIPDYSEAELTDCLYKPDTEEFGCNGGYASAVFRYVQNKGVTSEYWYPFYHNVDHTQCYLYDSDPKYVVAPRVITRIIDMYPRQPNETEILNNMYTYGPFYVLIDADFLGTYKKGILNPKKPSTGWNLNHCVMVVGHCVDSATNTPYWIIKNSWGASWGESGYFRLISGKDALGITTNPVWISFN